MRYIPARFFRLNQDKPTFGVLLYIEADTSSCDLYIQVCDQNNKITAFKSADGFGSNSKRVRNIYRVEYQMQRQIGDERLVVFEMPDSEVLLGTSTEVKAMLEERLCKLEGFPAVLLRVAFFMGDLQLVDRAGAAIDREARRK